MSSSHLSTPLWLSWNNTRVQKKKKKKKQNPKFSGESHVCTSESGTFPEE